MAPLPKSIEAGHFSPDILDFVRLLNSHGVQYLVVGGEAVIFYGHARFTGDVDFFFADSPANVLALYSALVEFWAGSVPGIESAQELAEPAIVVQFGRPPNRIDLLNRIDGVEFQDAWESRLEITIQTSASSDLRLNLLGLENLIKNKRASGRPKDLEDLTFLETLSHAPE